MREAAAARRHALLASIELADLDFCSDLALVTSARARSASGWCW
jgi:hypothetical protein